MHRDAIIQNAKAILLYLFHIGTGVMAFIEHAMPLLQFVLLIVSIAAALASCRASIATHDAIKNSKK